MNNTRRITVQGYVWAIVLTAFASLHLDVQAAGLNDKRHLCAIKRTTSNAVNSERVNSPSILRSATGGAQVDGMRTAIVSGIILAFNSGFINGCCLSGGVASDGTPQAVAAVTGAWTTSAVGLAKGNHNQFATQSKIILSFLSGSAISGLLNPYPSPFVLTPGYGVAFLFGSLLLAASSHLAKQAAAGKSFFYLAAIANGIQNSISSTHTANLCRTTHYSGISSDMGTFLGQVIRGNSQNLLKLKVFSTLALAFWSGGFISFRATNRFASSALLFSSGFYALIGLAVLSQCKRKT